MLTSVAASSTSSPCVLRSTCPIPTDKARLSRLHPQKTTCIQDAPKLLRQAGSSRRLSIEQSLEEACLPPFQTLKRRILGPRPAH